MKIAIASTGKEISADVSSISGRAPFYLIFEGEKLVKTIKNPFRVGGGGAGLAVAQMLEDEGVNLVVSGKFGDKMQNSLHEKGIEFKSIQDLTVAEALKQI